MPIARRCRVALASLALGPLVASAAGAAGDPALAALLAPGLTRGYPGLAVLVEEGGGTPASAAAGFADLERRTPLAVDDPFHMASITKAFTEVAALQLVDQGKLSLAATVAALLGDEVARLPHAETITVAQLLDHSSGIYAPNNDLDYLTTVLGPGADPARIWTPAELLALADRDRRPPAAAPGVGHHYSDLNSVLLGRIVERVAGRPFKSVVTSTLLEPLGMASTYFYSDALAGTVRPQRPTARGYLLASEELRGFIAIHPMFRAVPGAASAAGELLDVTLAAERIDSAAGLVTTLPDLHRFAAALFRGRLLSPASQTLLTAVATGLADEPAGSERTWALEGRRAAWGVAIFKGGDSPGGFNTLMAYQPERDAVLLAFTNSFGHFDEKEFLFDEVFGKRPARR